VWCLTFWLGIVTTYWVYEQGVFDLDWNQNVILHGGFLWGGHRTDSAWPPTNTWTGATTLSFIDMSDLSLGQRRRLNESQVMNHRRSMVFWLISILQLLFLFLFLYPLILLTFNDRWCSDVPFEGQFPISEMAELIGHRLNNPLEVIDLSLSSILATSKVVIWSHKVSTLSSIFFDSWVLQLILLLVSMSLSIYLQTLATPVTSFIRVIATSMPYQGWLVWDLSVQMVIPRLIFQLYNMW